MDCEFEVVVQPASKLKNIVEVIQGIYDSDTVMQVSHDGITITVQNMARNATIAYAPIAIILCSEWFRSYSSNTPPGQYRTISFGSQQLCDILLRRVEDGDILTITGRFSQEGSNDGHLFFSFNNPYRKGMRNFRMNVRGSEPPSKQPSSADGFGFVIYPSSLFPVVEICCRNQETFSLTLSKDVVKVAIGQQYSYALTEGIQSDYVLSIVPEEGDHRTYVVTMSPQYTELFNRAISRSSFIFVTTAPPESLPQARTEVTASIDTGSAWFTFFPDCSFYIS